MAKIKDISRIYKKSLLMYCFIRAPFLRLELFCDAPFFHVKIIYSYHQNYTSQIYLPLNIEERERRNDLASPS
jgi:hypothetical protein